MPDRAPRKPCRSCGAFLASDNTGEECTPCARLGAEDLTGVAPRMPEDLWDRPQLREAFAQRHFGRVLRAYRTAVTPEITQAAAGRWIGLTQGQVSRMERASAPVQDLGKLDRWARALGIPQRCLWFTLTVHASDACAPAPALPTLEAQQGEGSDVRRRDLFKAASVAAAAGSGLLAETPWQRLVESVTRDRPVDATTVQLIEDRTAEFFHAEETQPAREIVAAMRQHRHTLTALLHNAAGEQLRTRLLTATGETDVLLGWLLFDLDQPAEAVKAWRRTLVIAKQTGDGALAACALGYWSYLASTRGDTEPALRLLRQAEGQVSGSSAPATRSWIAVRQAEEAARLGDTTTSLRALDRAITAFDFAKPRTERPWTAFFTAGRLGSSTVATYTTLGHPEAETAADSLLASLSLADNKVRGLVLADLATAAANGRDYDRADNFAAGALNVASRTEATLVKSRLRALATTLPTQGTGTAARLRERISHGLITA